MKKYELWDMYMYEDHKLLIDIENIKEAVWCDSILYTTKEGIDGFYKQLDNDDYLSLIDFLDENDIEYNWCNEWQTIEELQEIEKDGYVLVDRQSDDEIFKSNELETVRCYEWWDGSRFKNITDETIGTTEVVITDDSVCLDEWDGNNWKTGYDFYHEYVHKILEIDGELAEGEYLVREVSQYQGDHITATIYSESRLMEHIKELKDYERDVEEYMSKINKL